MNLINENEEKVQDEKKKNTLKIIIILIAVFIVLAIILTIIFIVKDKNTLKLQIDNTNRNIQSGLVLMDTNNPKEIYVENDQIYLSVKMLASILGKSEYEYGNGEEKIKNEDKTKCQIKTKGETTSYISNSSEIYKSVSVEDISEDDNENNTISNSNSNDDDDKYISEYEYFNIENGVKYVNEEIYASTSAIELGFNVSMGYDAKTKTITIMTLNELENIAKKKVTTAVIGDDCKYYNKKLLKYGLTLVKNNDNKYGIVDYINYQDGNYVASPRYSYIRFCEDSNTIIITDAENNKQGIMKLNLETRDKAETKIEPKNYDLIKQIDDEQDLYLIKQSKRYGVIKIEHDTISTILKSNYQKIGIDTDSSYEYMDNKYIINNKYIPIKQDDKWGLASINGNIIISPQYYEIGCDLGDESSGDPVIILPKLIDGSDGIVFMTSQKNKDVGDSNASSNVDKYSIVNIQTKQRVETPDAVEIYSKNDGNHRKYFLKFVDQVTGDKHPINIYDAYGKGNTNNSGNSDNDDSDEDDSNNTDDTETNNTNNNENNTNSSENNTNTN